jgi:hypothetical protein
LKNVAQQRVRGAFDTPRLILALGLAVSCVSSIAQTDPVFLAMKAKGVVEWNSSGYWQPTATAKRPILIHDESLVIRERFYSNGSSVVLLANILEMKPGSLISTGFARAATAGAVCGANGHDGKNANDLALAVVQVISANISVDGQKGGPGAEGCQGAQGSDSTVASQNGQDAQCQSTRNGGCFGRDGKNGDAQSGRGEQGRPGFEGGNGGNGGDAGVNPRLVTTSWSDTNPQLVFSASGGEGGEPGDGGDGGRGGAAGPIGANGRDAECGSCSYTGGEPGPQGQRGAAGSRGWKGKSGLAGSSKKVQIELMEKAQVLQIIEAYLEGVASAHKF